MQTLIAKTLRCIVHCAAASYIAGPNANDAIRICRQMGQRGLNSTICPWDGPNDPPEIVAESYKEALNSIIIEDGNIDCYLSIKVPSINYDFDILKDLINIAQGHDVRIHFDSLAPDTADRSIALLERALTQYKNIGYTLPSSWQRSLIDAEKIVDFGIPVRIIKGQWPDQDFHDIDVRSNYFKIVAVLAGRAVHVGVATHDLSLARESIHRLKDAGTVCELEQLYGLPNRADSVAKPVGIPARVYIPYGYAYLSYALSAMRKRPIICVWLVRDFLVGIKRNYLPRNS